MKNQESENDDEDLFETPQPSLTFPSNSSSSSPSLTPKRMWSPNDAYASYNFCVVELESFEESIKEAVQRKAMKEEIYVIEKNKTWELVDRPKDKDISGVK